MVRYICNKTFYVNQQDTDGNHRCRRKLHCWTCGAEFWFDEGG